ncbi:MAG TPA: PilW family protein [Nevskiaceae bacterium]|nr:PilW family protein [Nevskiaceae bacterium]
MSPLSLKRRPAGFTLVELMIAMVLGIMLVGGVSALFLSNKQSYGTNQSLGEVQDNTRIAFELLARDIRQAGLTCNNNGRVTNVLNNAPPAGGTDWWADFANAIRGYDNGVADPAVTSGTGVAQRVASTDSIQLMGAGDTGLSVQSQNPASANVKINEQTADLHDGDIIMICDPDHAAIVQISNYNSSNVTLVHNTGNSVSPGNCAKDLGYPTNCGNGPGSYAFGPNSMIAVLKAVDWYIGNNAQGGRSLYRVTVGNVGGTPTASAQEMVRNVTDMQITYHRATTATYIDATTVGAAANWTTVDAVQISLTFVSTDTRSTTTANQRLQRQMSTIVTLRNRIT